MNQYLIDYTVRNITTGDEEETRLLEYTDDELAAFPEPEVAQLIRPAAEAWREGQLDYAAWNNAQTRIVEVLRPYMTNVELFDRDYGAWETWLLDSSH